MVRKRTPAQLKKKLWKVFSEYIRRRDNFICFTCGRQGSGSGIHAGHCIPKAAGGLSLYFHERNNHAQCYNCNINLGGNGAIYAKRIREVYGEEAMDELYALKNKIVKWSPADYERLIDDYKTKLQSLK